MTLRLDLTEPTHRRLLALAAKRKKTVEQMAVQLIVLGLAEHD